MNIFDLLAGLVVWGGGIATLVALIVVACGMRRRPWRATVLRMVLCCLPLACVVALTVWLLGPADYTNPQDLSEAYRAEFGADPPSDVTDSQVRVAAVGDWWGAWHRFHAADSTMDSLSAKFEPIDRESFSQAAEGGSTPGWWKPDADGIDAYYVAHHWRNREGHSEAYLGIARAKGLVYFYHDES